MLIYLLRHGDASNEVLNDKTRPLSEEGKISIGSVARYIYRQKMGITRIITSPLLRAWQTAEIVTDVLNLGGKIEKLEDLLPGSNPQNIVHESTTLNNDERVLLVGHQPFLGMLISHLICNGISQVEVKKASLSCVEIQRPINIGKGVLKFLINPENII